MSRLRSQLSKEIGRANSDEEAFLLDVANGHANIKTMPYPIFKGSHAEDLPHIDIALEKHKQFAPKDLRMIRPEYSSIPAKVFRDHIYGAE